MKYLICFFITLTTWSCIFQSDYTSIGKLVLGNGDQIELLYRGGGATASDVIWVQKTSNSKDSFIAKINYHKKIQAKLWQINDSIIIVRLIDTAFFKGKFRDFRLNLNKRIYPNDGSPYAE